MDNLLLTNYKPDYTNNVMTISFTVNSLAISSVVTIAMSDFNTAIATGVDAVKLIVLDTLITGLQALVPTAVTSETTTTTTTDSENTTTTTATDTTVD